MTKQLYGWHTFLFDAPLGDVVITRHDPYELHTIHADSSLLMVGWLNNRNGLIRKIKDIDVMGVSVPLVTMSYVIPIVEVWSQDFTTLDDWAGAWGLVTWADSREAAHMAFDAFAPYHNYKGD